MNTIRITSGLFKGRSISTPGGKTHPMGERERLALFNMIVDYVPGSRVLDAFSGSGALGIEALSRGSESVVFIENNHSACQTIRKNLEKLGIINSNAKIIEDDCYKILAATTEKWGVVLADPPYDKYDEEKIKLLASVVADGGVLVLSHPGESPEMPGLKLMKSRNYANATISVFVK